MWNIWYGQYKDSDKSAAVVNKIIIFMIMATFGAWLYIN